MSVISPPSPLDTNEAQNQGKDGGDSCQKVELIAPLSRKYLHHKTLKSTLKLAKAGR
jgi:hypothetical protein